jgi:hypothetical protein
MLGIRMLAHGEENFFDFLVSFGGHAHSHILPAQFPHQPGAGHCPVPFHRPLGNAKGLGDLFDVHAGEKTHFDDLGLARIEFGEFFHRFVEGEDFFITLWSESDGFVEFDSTRPTAAFLAFPLSGVIDQDSAHGLSADGEKMGAALPIDTGLVDEPQIGFVHQGGWLEGVIGSFVAEMACREGFEFVVDKRHELGGDCGAVAAF